jgi:uncharacterized damage-inducible protein DinB
MIYPDLPSVPSFYKGYVDSVRDHDLYDILKKSNDDCLEVVHRIPEELGEYRYAEGKWSIKELLCHMQDAERIFAYRALRFARNDKTPLSGFEEKDFAPQANAHSRTVNEIANELKRLRSSTIDLYKSFSQEMLRRTGTANNTLVSVLNLGFIIPGHETHHCKVLTERYLKR